MAAGGGSLRAAEMHLGHEAGGSSSRKIGSEFGLGKRREGSRVPGERCGGRRRSRRRPSSNIISRVGRAIIKGNLLRSPIVVVVAVIGLLMAVQMV